MKRFGDESDFESTTHEEYVPIKCDVCVKASELSRQPKQIMNAVYLNQPTEVGMINICEFHKPLYDSCMKGENR